MIDKKGLLESLIEKAGAKPETEDQAPVAEPGKPCPTCGQDVPEASE